MKMNSNLITINVQRGNATQKFIPGLEVSEYERISQLIFEHNKSGYYFLFSNVVRHAKRLAQYLNYLTYRDQSYKTPCYAGRLNVTLYNTGKLHPCEMLNDTYGNVREFDYDLKGMLTSSKARDITAPIIQDRCFCTHECNQITNVLFNPRYLPQLLFGPKGMSAGSNGVKQAVPNLNKIVH